MAHYFTLFSTTGRSSPCGLRPQVRIMTTADIIMLADAELSQSDKAFEDMAGVRWRTDDDGYSVASRELGHDELFELALKKLRDDGRLFRAFDTDAAGANAFIEASAHQFIADEARALVAGWNGFVELLIEQSDRGAIHHITG